MPFSDRAALRAASEWFSLVREPDGAEHQAAFDAWLAESDANRLAYSQVAEAFSLGKKLQPPLRVQPRVAPSATRRPFKALSMAVGLSAIALIAAGLAVPYVKSHQENSSGRLATQANRFHAPIGKIKVIRLSDGSTVTLDTDTDLRQEFSSDHRDLWLEHGRARFEVAHEARPFVVHAAGGTVTAHGTIFDVRLDHGRATVRLLRGAVEVEMTKTGQSRQRQRLAPGDAVGFNVTDGVIPLSARQKPQILQTTWPDAMLDFDKISIQDLAAEANRYSATKIILADPAIANATVSGTFRVGDPYRLARHLAALLDLNVSQTSEGAVMLSRLRNQPSS